MPYHDEEYPGQPLWQSVLLFCCKGMIEGIMVVLFFWLLVQVLFTKQLEVHLQALLLVGLIVFCLCLLLGCFLCWRQSPADATKDKAGTTPPPPANPVTSGADPPPSGQDYETLDGDVLEFPSTFSSPAPSEREGSPSGFFKGSEGPARPLSYFSMRRLSTPPLYRPIDAVRSFPKPGILSRALQRRCTVSGGERDGGGPAAPGPGCAIPLLPLKYSSASSPSPAPCMHFTMTFSPERQTLGVTVLGLTGAPRPLEEVYLLGSLPPLHPAPRRAVAGPGARGRLLLLDVSSAEELHRCTFRVDFYERDPGGPGAAWLGGLELECGGRDWGSGHIFHFKRELHANAARISKDAHLLQGLSCPPQIFILLQYQALLHQIKVTVLRADNLDSPAHGSAPPDYRVAVNLRHQGALISSRETKGATFTVWNASFLFDLPPGDISQLPLTMEFILSQTQAPSGGQVLGRVLIGTEAADAGRAHWRDMCGQQGEQTRWHTVQP